MTDAKNPGERVRKRSVTVAGHATSVSLEEAFWRELAGIAEAEGISVNALITRIDRERGGRGGNLSSAIRVHVLERARRR
jgi:predicted DNA-binding ribbon-helix-helix protein